MVDWPGKPDAPQDTWPGTPARAIAARWPGKPDTGFVADLKSAAGRGVSTMGEALAHPERHTFGAWPSVVGGAMQVIGAPITAAGAAIEREFPALKRAQQQGQILPLESAADIIGTGAGLVGGRLGIATEPPAEASVVRKILSPATVSPEAEQAAGALREAGGTAARATRQTEAALQPYERQINSLPPQQQLEFLDYMEGRGKGAKIPDPALQSFADEFRDAMKLRADKIKNSDIEAGVLEDYVTHFWKDPAKARSFVGSWMSKQGSGRSLRERTIPTIAEGIAAGLEPITSNPLEIAMRYVTSMDKHIAMQEVLRAGEQAGSVKWLKVGERHIPDGWKPLNGYLADKVGTRAYAPEDWARIWNNYVSPGVYRNVDLGNAYQAFRNMSNITTQTVLSLSGYHLSAMAEEAVLSQAARGVSQIIGGTKLGLKGLLRGDVGQILRGGEAAARGIAAVPTSLAAPVTTALKGRKFQQVYLDRTLNSPKYRPVVDLFEKAGGRAVGKFHAPDYQFSSAGSYFSSWRRGSLKMEMRGAMKDIREAKYPMFKAAQTILRGIGRSFETLSQPLFEKYIPMLKDGAIYDTMSAWLQANPAASYEEQMAVARRIVDSIDNRFGEMIQDNIFWHTLAKQTATIGMLSYSWNLGTIRELGGGAVKAARTLGGAADIASARYDPRVAYVIAFPMVIATINGIYQYIKTGKPPQSAQDLMAPPTGGTAPGFGGHSQVPERAILPGYQKDVFGWYWNTVPQEVFNKLNPFFRMGYEAITKQDWRGDPIIRPDPTVPQWLYDYFMFVTSSLNPIVMQRFGHGEMKGSRMGVPEEFLGIRPAPQYLQDPEGYTRGMTAIEKKKWLRKQEHDRALRRKYGGPQSD